MTSYTDSVIEYFAEKADQYDRTDEQLYWRLSDELLWHLLQTRVISGLPNAPKILDAGGGTGRWTDRFLRAMPEATAVIFDLSKEMTDQARAKAERNGYSDRLEIVVGDLAEVSETLTDHRFDLAISFHNVLGFVQDPDAAVRDLVALLKPEGQIALFVPNKYHAMYFNVSIGDVSEAGRILSSGRGRFTSTMPDMHMFTPENLRRSSSEAGLENAAVLGTPLFIYPGYAESQIEGSTSSLVDVLASDEGFAAVLELEKTHIGDESLAVRGNNLFLHGQRTR